MTSEQKRDLMQLFHNVDKDRSGTINEKELQQALSNGTWNPFNILTVRMMIGMFDRSGSNTINFEGFAALCKYVEDWENLFDKFDKVMNEFIIFCIDFYFFVTFLAPASFI